VIVDVFNLPIIGGDVTVTSEPSKGSVFTVRLPGGAAT
jgi:signal transduction histidine kinase